ncbi:MAG: hypothetical protein WEB53_14910 [Akkermansiaceae bacterium]
MIELFSHKSLKISRLYAKLTRMNSYRKACGTEEFQWILKLGVWLRTQIEKETVQGQLAAKAFCSKDRIRARRRVQQEP